MEKPTKKTSNTNKYEHTTENVYIKQQKFAVIDEESTQNYYHVWIFVIIKES